MATFRLTAVFFLIMFVIGTDTFLISPLIPTLQNELNVPTGSAGWMIGAYTLGSTVLALVSGPLSDGMNRKRVLIAGLTCFAISTALCGIATDFWTMCLFRLLAGISAAFTTPQVWAGVPTLFPPAKIPRMMGVIFAGLAASQALGVPIGSLLATVHWSFPFFAIGFISLLLAVCALFAVPDMKPRPASGLPALLLGRYIPLVKSGRARGGFLGYFLIHLGSASAFAFLGKWMADRFGLSVGETGYVIIGLGLGNLLGSLLSGYVVKKLNPLRTTTAALLFLAALYAALPHAASAGLVSAIFFILFAVLGVLFPLVVAMLNSLNAQVRGTISSLSTSMMNGATTAGAWIAGMLYAGFGGYESIGLFSAGCFLASLITLIISGMMRPEAKERAEVQAT
ncbi:MFS transporter [Cohnella lubricantis]|uniref:MFS transporter n=1 Tax=Cohnella lubricantis TaxID=2163172 RepID=A0A841TDF0_9BACL|nr:MFS transporter [Cohnella lubricantis]MBB6679324.1 MFS transporter [Cohnella lubricantis]MBP2120115.1 putative MFS family arabinose efflux permease [Cohnella lubricantis]